MPEAYAIFLNKELCLMVNSFQKIKMHVKKEGLTVEILVLQLLIYCSSVTVL